MTEVVPEIAREIRATLDGELTGATSSQGIRMGLALHSAFVAQGWITQEGIQHRGRVAIEPAYAKTHPVVIDLDLEDDEYKIEPLGSD